MGILNVYIPDIGKRCAEEEASWEHGRERERKEEHINEVLTGHETKDTQ